MLLFCNKVGITIFLQRKQSMIMSNIKKRPVVSLVFFSSLLIVTGCFWQKEKSSNPFSDQSDLDRGEVLLSVNGKPVLYAQDFEEQKAMAQQSNPQLNMILQMMPDVEYSMLFKSMQAGYLMKEWVIKQGIDQDPELQKQRRQYHDAIDLQLYMKYYQDAHPVEVSDKQAEEYYLEKRDQIPGLVIAPAGVDIIYVPFNSKTKAEEFAAKVKDGSTKHVKLAAKEAGLTTKTMTINENSDVDDALKNSVLAATKFPSKEIVKIADNSYWVVGMLKKKKAEYRSFDTPEVKQGIIKMCTDEKREAALTKEVEKLTNEYNVVENKEYFENKKQRNAQAMEQFRQQMMQAQQDQAEGLDVSALDDKN